MAFLLDGPMAVLFFYFRMENPSEATAVITAAKEDGLPLAAEVEEKGAVSLVEGDEEKSYYVSFACPHIFPRFFQLVFVS